MGFRPRNVRAYHWREGVNAYKYGGVAALFALATVFDSAAAFGYRSLFLALLSGVPMFATGWCCAKASWS
jgi:hypothetical protein